MLNTSRKKYGVLVLDTSTGNYRVSSVERDRYTAVKVAQRLRDDMNDPFDGIGQDSVKIAPMGR